MPLKKTRYDTFLRLADSIKYMLDNNKLFIWNVGTWNFQSKLGHLHDAQRYSYNYADLDYQTQLQKMSKAAVEKWQLNAAQTILLLRRVLTV